jgi:hypothetical protein
LATPRALVFDDLAPSMGPRIDQTLCNADGITIENGRQVPFYAPNFDFEHDPEQEKPLDLAADMLAKVTAEIIPAEGPIHLELVGQKFVALHFLLNRNGGATMTGIAERAGISKQLLSHHANRLGEKLRFHGQNQKSIKCRTIFSESTKARWAALTPEQRIARRAGKKAAQSAPRAA